MSTLLTSDTRKFVIHFREHPQKGFSLNFSEALCKKNYAVLVDYSKVFQFFL